MSVYNRNHYRMQRLANLDIHLAAKSQYGRLGGLTRQGCTFHPEELGTLSRYRAERYIPLRDTYQLLYRLEMQNEIEYKGLRRKLNGCYENFTALLGDLNKKENAAFILNDPGGRSKLLYDAQAYPSAFPWTGLQDFEAYVPCNQDRKSVV